MLICSLYHHVHPLHFTFSSITLPTHTYSVVPPTNSWTLVSMSHVWHALLQLQWPTNDCRRRLYSEQMPKLRPKQPQIPSLAKKQLLPASGSLDFVGMDVVGSFPGTTDGYMYILIITSRYSKLNRAIPVSSTTTTMPAKKFFWFQAVADILQHSSVLFLITTKLYLGWYFLPWCAFSWW